MPLIVVELLFRPEQEPVERNLPGTYATDAEAALAAKAAAFAIGPATYNEEERYWEVEDDSGSTYVFFTAAAPWRAPD